MIVYKVHNHKEDRQMTNLKEKILQALKHNKQVDIVLEDLSTAQENLLENYSNPAIKKNDKNKILKKFTNLKNIEKLIYRFNKLSENNYNQDAKEEKENVETIVLKGSISSNYYIWHAENSEDTCDVCKSLDGQKFDFYDEMPKRPHPNCKCTVEIIEETNSNDDSETYTKGNDNTTKTLSENQNSQTSIPQPSSKSSQQTQPQKWIKPCSGPIVGHYGEPRSTHVHNGIDIAVPIGTPIKAVADGKVYYAGANDPNGYGKYVIITHTQNGKIVTSEYGHLSSWNVQAGQSIKQGQIIAKSGNTGHSQGPHLHITIREGAYKGIPVNPNKYFNY